MSYKPSVIQGVGIGLRPCHYHHIITQKPTVAWFELLTDNYLANQGIPLSKIDTIRADYPMTLHGVGLSIGSTDPLNTNYLKQLLALIKRWQPAWISDHLCWSSIHGHYLHELLPLPYTREALQHVCDRISFIQDQLFCPLLIENVSSYLQFIYADMSEWEFLNALAKKTGCKILLDVNNIYVSATNHDFNADEYLLGIDKNHVGEIHLAGHQAIDNILVDTHSAEISAPVLDLYQKAIGHFGEVPTLIEWDNDIPDFSILLNQVLLTEKSFAFARGSETMV
jgi:uncharacterized protein (UPF0276 family)